jgi:hypothetical protein
MLATALVIGAYSLKLTVDTEDKLGALPALWKLQTDVESLQEYLENPGKSFLQITGPDCDCINNRTAGPDCDCINDRTASKTAAKGPDCDCINDRTAKGPDCDCINDRTASKTSAAKGPDCDCINDRTAKGPDCDCINDRTEATPTSLVAKKGPDCACIGKTEGPDCACIGKEEEKHALVAANKTAPTNDSAPAVDTETADLLAKAKSVDTKDMPMMLAVLEAMYGRFKENIKSANALEAKTKKHYEENMASYKLRKEKNKDDKAMDRMAEYWEKSRKLSHQHYHAMLKVAHAGMARLQMAIDMMGKAVEGKSLDKKELDNLKAVTPAPTVVFLQVREDLLKYCHEALVELAQEKKTK